VENSGLVWEEGFDASQVTIGIAPVVARSDPVGLAHDPGPDDAAVLCQKEGFGEASLFAVVLYAVCPVHVSLSHNVPEGPLALPSKFFPEALDKAL
jgi:hypothetical protein